MKVLINKNLIYIPEWNGNRKLPKDEQMQVKYRYMTGPEKEDVMKVDLEFDDDGTPKKGYKVKMDRETMVRICIQEFINLTVQDGEKTRPAVVEDLIRLPEFSQLYREVTTFLLTENTGVDKKK